MGWGPPEGLASAKSAPHCVESALAVLVHDQRMSASVYRMLVGEATSLGNDEGASPVVTSTRFFEVIVTAAFCKPVALVDEVPMVCPVGSMKRCSAHTDATVVAS